MKKEVSKTKSGIKIAFSGDVKKENIVKMVQNCAQGECECMSDETKAKIKDMRVDGKDGDVKLELEGEIEIEEIKNALSRSKVLKS